MKATIDSVLAVFVALLVTTCGGGREQNASSPDASGSEIAVSMIVQPARLVTIDNLVAAGWKKSKDFDPSPLPRATAATFGFYNKKDIEVWFYASHSDAVEFGVGPAEQAIARRPGQTDYLIPQTNRYHAYAVVGNVVMLCEFELADCQALITKLP